MAQDWDVIVVGAGPAGSTLSAFLGARGLRVLLLDRDRFPRRKPCGEFMSPEALATLDRSGALPRVEALPHRRLFGHEIWSYDGSHLRGDYAPFGKYRPFRPYGLAVQRLLLDHELLKHAATFPSVTVREGFRVEELILRGGRVQGVRGVGDRGPETFFAPLTVGADGIHSIVARRLGLTEPDRGLRKCAMVAYFKGMEIGDHGEVHLTESGYFAMAPVDGDLVNINFIVDQSKMRGVDGDAEGFYRRHLMAVPRLAARLRNAVLVGKVATTGPMARRSRGTVAPGAMLVGDSTEFVDPVTGEGIFLAVRSAEIAAGVIPAALSVADPDAPVLADYHRLRGLEFGERLNSCRIVQRYLYRPWITNWVVRTLGAKPWLADRIIGMSGDYIPPAAVFNLPFILSVLNPFTRVRGTVAPARAIGS